MAPSAHSIAAGFGSESAYNTPLTGVEHFIDVEPPGPELTDYLYDENGNLIYDRNKNITITYNHLNKPTLIKFGTTDSIEYFYDATGTKLRQRVSSGGASKTDYVGEFHYEHDVLQFFAHEEGRVVNDGTGILMYQYNLTDHLGNVRLTYEAFQWDDYHCDRGCTG